MLEAIFVEVLNSLSSNLASYARDQILLAWGLNTQVKKLQRTMATIEAMLEDYSQGNNTKSRTDQEWLFNLHEVVYELDDLFDEILAKVGMKKLMEGNTCYNEVKLFFSSSNQIYTSFVLAQRVKSIRELLDDISKDRRDFGLASNALCQAFRDQDGGGDDDDDVYVPDNIVGRKVDKQTIIDMVLGDLKLNSDHDEGGVDVIPIVGVGGLGKTTLARQVYSDDKVRDFFDLRLWVSVPHEMKVKEVMERVVSTATDGKDVGKCDLEQLRIRLSEHINGKKYILVLDNVWDENPLRWRDLKPMLTLGAAPGSKILVTTRSLTVGDIMGTVQPYQLQPLSVEDSRALFERIVFLKKGRHESGTRELVGEILGMCRNVPLVIRALAGVLATKFTVREWMSFKKDELSNLASYGEDFDVMRILRLSYDYLKPSNLKSCFSYFSLFPMGYVFSKRRLVCLWIAQGFVDPLRRGESLEDVGEGYLNTLKRKSLIQDVEGGEDGTCKLHDLMYDLSCSVSGGQCKMLRSSEDCDFGRNMRHISIGYQLDSCWRAPAALQPISQLRASLLTERPSYEAKMCRSVCDNLISSFLCLRALDLHGLGIQELPKSIGKLIHLRYLNLSSNMFKEVPNSVTLLHNLQYLELYECEQLFGIPRDMKKLVNLRHLLIPFWISWGKMRYFPSGLENLTNLQSLEVFVVPDSNDERVKSISGGRTSKCARLGDLNSLNNIRGSLSIIISGSYEDMALDAKKANLKGKKYLKSLTLCWVRGYLDVDYLVFENLQPHAQISDNLSIYEYHGENLPTWMATSQLASSLSHLTSITIHSCDRIKHIPSFARLPKLKSILYYNLPEVEYLESDIDQYEIPSSSSLSTSPISFFPSLTSIEIGHLHKLKGWGTSSAAADKSFPRVSVAKIYHCYKLESMPLCPNLQYLLAFFVPETLQILATCEGSGDSSIPSSSSATSSTFDPKLEVLELSTVEHLVLIPREYLQKVSKLIFGWGTKPLNFSLLEEALQVMGCLRTLGFFECQSLTSLSGLPVQLCTLDRLEFSGCDWAKDLIEPDNAAAASASSSNSNPWNVLKNLRSLKLDGIEKMEVLPRGIQCITTLETLELSKCPSLRAIPNWIGNLSSLSRLSIHRCQELTSLPEEIQRLQNLKQLVVDDCPRLADNCHKYTGEDWLKIQHIPDVIIRR